MVRRLWSVLTALGLSAATLGVACGGQDDPAPSIDLPTLEVQPAASTTILPTLVSPPVPTPAPTRVVSEGRIAFISDRSGRSEVWIVDPDGSDLIQVTTSAPSAPQITSILWSPDGTKLVFSRFEGTPGQGTVTHWAVDVGSFVVTESTEAAYTEAFNVGRKSADGLYSFDDRGVLRAASGAEVSAGYDLSRGSKRFHPSKNIFVVAAVIGMFDGVSPEERQRIIDQRDIQATQRLSAGKFGIYVFPVPDGPPVLLSPLGNANEPSWSPDGARVSYSRDVDGDLKAELIVVPANGSAVETSIVPGDVRRVIWSPN